MQKINCNNVELYRAGEIVIRKIIWMLWFQGIENAPYIVKKCLASWKRNNPSWTIIFLDKNNIKEYIDTSSIVANNKQYITKTSLSDIVRINLLNKYGGIWVDATVYCMKPLEDWLSNYISAGFFMFRPPLKSYPISSWFIVSNKNSYITSTLCTKVNKYWQDNIFSNQIKSSGKFVSRLTRRLIEHFSYRSIIFSMLFNLSKRLRVYPYFWFHYTFAMTIKEDVLFRKKWDSVPFFNADIPHRLQHFGLLNTASESIKREIDNKIAPLYKLTWKYDANMYSKDCVFYYLLETKQNE